MDKSIKNFLAEKTIEFGKHKGKKIKDAPDDYHIWMYKNTTDNGKNNNVRYYGSILIKERRKEIV